MGNVQCQQSWASYQIRKIAGCACAGNAGNVFPGTRKPQIKDPCMHHGTCVTHVAWCMSGSLTRSGGENVPGIPGACTTRNFAYLVRDLWRMCLCLVQVTKIMRVWPSIPLLKYTDDARQHYRRWLPIWYCEQLDLVWMLYCHSSADSHLLIWHFTIHLPHSGILLSFCGPF